MLKHLSERPLQGADEAGRFNVDLLRLANLLAEVLHFHDIELWDERVDYLTLLVNCTSIFKLSTKMQLTLDLKLVLKHSVDPFLLKDEYNKAYLKHVGSHGVVELMTKRLVFKIEFHCSFTCGHLNQSEENLNRSFRDGLQRVRLAELYLIAA